MSRRLLSCLVPSALLLGSGCAFEDAKPVATLVEPLAGRWCRPVDVALEVEGRQLAARWVFAADQATVERSLDGVVFETATWSFERPEVDGEAAAATAPARLRQRTIATPEVLSMEDEALVRAHPLDGLQALAGDGDDWQRALVAHEASCDVLPSAYGHGYPAAEGWYVAGAESEAQADASSADWSGGWYGHGGDAAGAPFAPDRSRLIVITYDAAERMVEEWLDRGASDGGPHDLLRTRRFDDLGVLVEDRVERWSPTPKEDILRVLSFGAHGPTTLRRALVDTWDSTLDVRFIPKP